MKNDWERLHKVIKWAGKSTNSFALCIGLPRSENLYQIKKGNHGISKQLAETITSTYPDISKPWLLTGEGEMLRSVNPEEAKKTVTLPYLDNEQNVEHFPLKLAEGAEYVFVHKNRSMLPLIDTGTMCLLRKADKSKIIGGNIYLLTFENQILLRIVRTKLGGATLVLEPINKEQFDEFEIQTSTVTDCYEVTALFTQLA